MESDPSTPAAAGRLGALGALALVLLAVVPFLPGARGAFLGDDVAIVRERSELRSPEALPELFTQTYWGEAGAGGLYRPLTLVSFALDGMVQGRGPQGEPWAVGVHRTNLALHAVVTLLVAALLRRRLRSAAAAWIGAALFAVHPVHVEPVVHLVGRADLLATLFVLAGLEAHHRLRAGPLVGALLYLAGMLSKEFAAMLPAVLLVEAWVDRAPGTRPGAFLRGQVRALAPYAVALVVFLGVRGLVLGANAEPPRAWALYVPGSYTAFRAPAPFEVAATMTHAFGVYLRLLVAPLALSSDYSGFPHHTGLALPVVVSALAWLTVAGAAALVWRRGSREPALWLAFFALAMLPVSNLVVTSGVIVAERALYLPSVALAAVVGWAALRLPQRPAWTAAALLVAAGAGLSWRHARVWSDPLTHFEHTVEHGPHHGHIAQSGLVAALLEEYERAPERETLARALPLAQQAAQEWPDRTNVLLLARCLELAGRPADALRCWAGLRAGAPRDPLLVANSLRLIEVLLARADDEARVRDLLARGHAIARASGDARLEAEWAARVAAGR